MLTLGNVRDVTLEFQSKSQTRKNGMKKRKSNKPKAVQAAVFVKRAAGESKRKIAKDLEISRNTVTAILDDTELNQFVERGKSIIFAAIPDAAIMYTKGAKEKFEHSESMLERLKVIPTRDAGNSGLTLNNFIGIGNLRRPDDRKPVLPEPKAT
jgi:hypothetical protein